MSTLLVTVDALRADHLAQYGYERDTMPVLDELLDESATRYAAAFANGTYTGVSLPSLLTSRYRGDDAIRRGPTVASALPESVATGGIHSNTFFASKADDLADFDYYDDFDVASSGGDAETSAGKRLFRRAMDAIRPTVDRLGVRDVAERVQEAIFPASLIHETSVYEDAAATTDRALSWLDSVDGEFFLWVHYMDPHRPYGIDVDRPRYGDPASEDEITRLMSTAGVHPDRVTPAERRRIVDLYDSDLRYTSEHVARLFDGLREDGRWEDAGVILTADHGEEFGDHGYYFHHNRPYDELLHVPLVVKSDRTDGGVVEEQRELLDVAPTICDLHGVGSPAAFRGRSLFEDGDRRVIATGSFRDQGRAVGVRWDGWKYIAVGDARELYDLRADPAETDDVAADNPDVCRRGRELIPPSIFEAEGTDVPDAEDVSSDVEERLEELGYLE